MYVVKEISVTKYKWNSYNLKPYSLLFSVEWLKSKWVPRISILILFHSATNDYLKLKLIFLKWLLIISKKKIKNNNNL